MIKLDGKKYEGYFYAKKIIIDGSENNNEMLEGYSLYEGYGKIKKKTREISLILKQILVKNCQN